RRCFFFSSRRRHTRCYRDWSSDVCSSDLFSTAFVSGGAALLLQVNTRTNQEAAADALGETANELPGGLGDGRIDLYRALMSVIRSEERRVGKEGRCRWARWKCDKACR